MRWATITTIAAGVGRAGNDTVGGVARLPRSSTFHAHSSSTHVGTSTSNGVLPVLSCGGRVHRLGVAERPVGCGAGRRASNAVADSLLALRVELV